MIEPAPLVYARSVIAPFEPVDGSRADHVRCSVSASTGAAVKAMRIANEISAAVPRRRMRRTSLAPEVLVPAGTFVRIVRVGTPEGSPQEDGADLGAKPHRAVDQTRARNSSTRSVMSFVAAGS